MPSIRPPTYLVLFACTVLALGSSSGCAAYGVRGTRGPDVPGTRPPNPPDPDEEALHPGERDADTNEVTADVHKTKYRGLLPTNVSNYQDKPGQFYDFVKNQGWNGKVRNRRCGGPACTGGVTSTKLIVQAIYDAHTVPVDLPSTMPGVVIGRIMNVGQASDAHLPIDPAAPLTPPDQYYFVVSHGTADQAVLQIAHLSFGLDAQPASLSVKTATGYVYCHQYLINRVTGVGDFRDCRGGNPDSGDGDSGDESRMMPNAFDASAWFSCEGGCCTAQWPP